MMNPIHDEQSAPALEADPAERHQWINDRRAESRSQRRPTRLARADHHSTTWDDRDWTSRLLHWIGDVTANATVGIGVGVLLLVWAGLGAEEGFPNWWQATLYSVAGSITLFMVFVIQHTQQRQTSATQRKLDELIRATDGADDNLIAVEETDDDHLRALAHLNYADHQRAVEGSNG